MNYQIALTNIEALCSEMRRCKPKEIRIEVSSEDIERGGTRVHVIAGFIDDVLYEAEIPCGTDWGKDKKASDKAKGTVMAIAAVAQECGTEVREGIYQLVR